MITITTKELLKLLSQAAEHILDDTLYNHLVECFHDLYEEKDWNYTTVSAIFIGFDLKIDRATLTVKSLISK